MKINRFSTITPAQYNPMSLQELMMVPMMKRKQHDELNNNIAATKAALAQADYMDMHDDKVSSLKKQLEDELNRQVSEVSANGISDSLRTDFINLNGEYQNAIGPKGVIGKAASAKKSVEQNRADLLANAVKMGHDPVETARQFEAAVAAYREAQLQSGDISNMDAVYAPKYRNLDDDLLRVKQMLGSTVETEKGDEGYHLERDEATDTLIMVTNSGQVITQDNFKQLEEANKMLQNDWLTEGSEGYRSAMWNGMSPEQIKQKIDSGLGIMEASSRKDTRQPDYRQISEGKDRATKPEKPEERKDTYTTNGMTYNIVPDGATAKEMQEKASSILRDKGNHSPQDVEEARQLQTVLERADANFRGEGYDAQGNPIAENPMYDYYKGKLAIVDKATEKLNVGVKGVNPLSAFEQFVDRHQANTGERYSYQKLKNGEYGLFRSKRSGKDWVKSRVGEGSITSEEYKELEKAVEVQNKFEKYEEQYKKDFLSRQGLERSDVFIPFDNTSERSTQTLNVLQSLTPNNVRPEHVRYINSSGIGEEVTITEDQRRGLVHMLKSANKEDINSINVSKVGNKAGITINFNPREGSSLEIPSNVLNPGSWGNDKSFDGQQGVEMFIPIDRLTDPSTGQKYSPTFLFDELAKDNPQLGYEIKKLVATTGMSATPNEGDLGERAVPVESIFPPNTIAPEGSGLDFKIEYDEKGRHVVPHIIQGDVKSKVKWGKVLTPDLFDDTPESDAKVDALIGTQLFNIIIKSSKLMEDGDGVSLYKKYGIDKGNLENENVEDYLTEVMSNDMKLLRHQDILEVSNYLNTIN